MEYNKNSVWLKVNIIWSSTFTDYYKKIVNAQA